MKRRKQEPGLNINWVTGGVAHFVVETKNGPIHFGIKMQKRPQKVIKLMDPLRRIHYVQTKTN